MPLPSRLRCDGAWVAGAHLAERLRPRPPALGHDAAFLGARADLAAAPVARHGASAAVALLLCPPAVTAEDRAAAEAAIAEAGARVACAWESHRGLEQRNMCPAERVQWGPAGLGPRLFAFFIRGWCSGTKLRRSRLLPCRLVAAMSGHVFVG